MRPFRCKTVCADSVAQLVEHYTFNVGVLGSSPSGITDSIYYQLVTRVKMLVVTQKNTNNLLIFQWVFYFYSHSLQSYISIL